MAGRVRRVSILLAVVAVGTVLVSTGSAKPRDSGQPAFPTLYAVYTMNCTFTIVDDGGRKVSSIAPGTYQVEVSTPVNYGWLEVGGCKGGWVQFELTGPGVNLSTTLEEGCENNYTLPPTFFKASSTFTAEDLNQPSATRSVFTTLASGSPTVPNSPYGPTSGKVTASTDIACSACKTTAKLRGTLTGTLSAAGKPTLTSKGKAVSILKAGRYRVAITDQDPKGSFTIKQHQTGPTDLKSTDLTGLEFVGKRSKIVTLRAGVWMYYSGRGQYYHFRVI
jgi:hypothetical protein